MYSSVINITESDFTESEKMYDLRDNQIFTEV